MSEEVNKRWVGDLYNRHPGETIYVVGSGTSMRVFPREFLEDKITIGLNMAWKIAPVTYGVTIHPDLNIPEYMEGEDARPGITWVVGSEAKARKFLSESDFQDAWQRHFWFEYRGQENTAPEWDPGNHGRIPDWVRQADPQHLYVWSSIAQTGMNLAANMGASTIVVLGCDCCALGENHHAHAQHTRWKGVDPNYRYDQYYEGMAEVRTLLRERGVEVVTMSPFLGLNRPEPEFQRLCEERGEAAYIASQDLKVEKPSKPSLLGGVIRLLKRAVAQF